MSTEEEVERQPDVQQDVQQDGFAEYQKQAWDMAMRYLQMGWSIIPLRLSDKRPAIKWEEYQDRQPTEEEVTAWFEHGVPDGEGAPPTKAFGIAIVTGKISGLVVLDCDNQDALAYAINEANAFSPAGVRTTRGQHMYFRHPGHPVTNKAGGVGRDWPAVAGLDLRGDGGYVVAPPSLKFNEEGAFVHQYQWTFPQEELEGIMSSFPVWPGITVRSSVQQPAGEWSFDNLTLAAVQTFGASVWDEMADRVKTLGRKLRDGDGRNPWLVRYIGECVFSGMDETQAREAGNQFQREFYEVELPAQEAETVLQSVIRTDRQNHPEKYAAKEVYDNRTPERQQRAAALRLITPKTLGELKALSAGSEYLIYPFIPPQAIIQVVGFNGHGKSIWLLNMLYAAARAQVYGSAYAPKAVRSLIMDHEGSATVLDQRLTECDGMHGPMSDNVAIWSANASGMSINLSTAEGLEEFAKLIDEVNPQVVVIDTVREAWSGMEENSPHAWVKVNAVAMAIRNSGRSVVLVHHRNKPTERGHGREAGSTAQLKDLDVQIFVTKVVEDLDQAKREASIPDETTQVVDAAGRIWTAWKYLRLMTNTDYTLRYVFELSFGKLRQATENHVPTFVGHAQNVKTGEWIVVSSKTPMQKAFLLNQSGMVDDDISAALGVPQPTVRRWIQINADSQSTKEVAP